MPPNRVECKESSLAIISAIPGTYQVRIHNSCICNEEIALRNRHLVDRSYIPFNNALWKAAFSYSWKQLTNLECKYTSIWKIANSYSGGKRNQYLRAADRLEVESLMRKDAILKMFVKPDKMSLADIGEKPPRAIQYRSPKYNLVLASYLKDLEHQFYQISTGPSKTHDIAKGKNLVQRAEDLITKSSYFKNPVFCNSDISKMDSCVRTEHQKECFRFYLNKFPSKTLKRVLYYQLNNKGYSKNNIKYKVKGTRASGDFTTGFENTLITWVCIRYIAHIAGVIVELYVDGDDLVIIMESVDQTKFTIVLNSVFPKLGFEIKTSWVKDIQELDFCQSRVLLSDPPRMARNPVRALSNFNVSLKNYPSKIWPRLIQAKADCERYGNPGVPILQQLGIKFDRKAKPMYDKEQEEILKMQSKAGNLLITDSVRNSYCIAWGLTPYEQELIEDYPDPGAEYTGTSPNYESISQQYATLSEESKSII